MSPPGALITDDNTPVGSPDQSPPPPTDRARASEHGTPYTAPLRLGVACLGTNLLGPDAVSTRSPEHRGRSRADRTLCLLFPYLDARARPNTALWCFGTNLPGRRMLLGGSPITQVTTAPAGEAGDSLKSLYYLK